MKVLGNTAQNSLFGAVLPKNEEVLNLFHITLQFRGIVRIYTTEICGDHVTQRTVSRRASYPSLPPVPNHPMYSSMGQPGFLIIQNVGIILFSH